VEDDFLMQLASEPTRGGTLLDLLFTNREGLVGGVVVRGHLELINHEMTEFSVHCEVKRGVEQNHHHGMSED